MDVLDIDLVDDPNVTSSAATPASSAPRSSPSHQKALTPAASPSKGNLEGGSPRKGRLARPLPNSEVCPSLDLLDFPRNKEPSFVPEGYLKKDDLVIETS